jgi:alkylation response protein AidB-like acyl-CoA dehydrogenase
MLLRMADDLILSQRDLRFLLYDWLEVEKLTSRSRYADHSRETFDAALELSRRIATERFAPHNKRNDSEEPAFDDGRVRMIPEVAAAVEAFNEAGLVSGSMDYSVGGMQLPVVVMRACLAWFQAANPGTASYPLLTIGNANLLLAHGSAEQIDTWVRPMVEGRFLGTMCLSEPQAGSSLADLTTRAEPQPDGSYRLFGNKMWISAGEHEIGENIVHLVLAKIPGGPPGVKGISLFIVPRFLLDSEGVVAERNDIVLAGLNHKMGQRGTTNALLNLGEGGYRPGGSAGAVGYLVGEPHQGLAYMFHMMNDARISVGVSAAAIGYIGYLHAVDYARTRLQGRPVGAAAGTPAVPIIEHADVRRMLLAQKAYVEGALALNLYCSRLVDEERTSSGDDATLLLEVLTPIAKAWPSQWCVEANSLAIQVHGGYGYTRDYDVEQFYRDNRLNAIHEGTNGIQGLDLLGRKVVMREGAPLRLLVETISETIRRAAGGEYADALQEALDRVVAVTQRLYGAGDITVTLANSSAYLEAVGHVVIAWIWLDQVLALGDADEDFAAGKRRACRYFYRWELPKALTWLDLLDSLDTTTLDMHPEWF